jgi:dihydrofolate reductase
LKGVFIKSKVFFDVGITIDGFIAGPNGGAKNSLGDGGIQIHNWMFKQKVFLQYLQLEDGETDNVDNDIIENIFNTIGANIMGKKMFVEGETNWPKESPFHTPVYVITKQKREPWLRKGETTFYFVDGDINTVLQKAKKDAGNKDVRISGDAEVIRQYLKEGFIDEFSIHLAPLFMGKGNGLFDESINEKTKVKLEKVIPSNEVTHLFYKVIKNQIEELQ